MVSHDSALDLWELGDIVPEGVHLTIPRSRRGMHVPPGVILHTVTTPLLPAEVQKLSGIRLTSVARSIADYELDAGRPDQVETMIREATERGVLHPPTVTLSPRRARALRRLGVAI